MPSCRREDLVDFKVSLNGINILLMSGILNTGKHDYDKIHKKESHPKTPQD
ncbi:hypothetical cytosolic protein [Syntrophus aciditrophicus SB]|uniref:Hypothetical cytosolic protein n=1 Tax=Syntrophus aciditrophicus (strain SB) TaxID=56780 RepID=Q2LW04_SYNAS|nr:hypothetical cytosolic protein [Syntrophus aciditrophicus SB]